jgi:ABC-2 type transport system permease protein
MGNKLKGLLSILKWEFKATAANKAYVIITIIGPFLILAVTIIPGLFIESTTRIKENTLIGIAGGDAQLVQMLEDSFAENNMLLQREDNLLTLQESVLNEELKAYIVIPSHYLREKKFTIYTNTGTDFLIHETLQRVLGDIVMQIKLEKAGIDPEVLKMLHDRPVLEMRKIEEKGKDESQDFFSVIMSVISFIMLLYMTILFYGQMIGRSVLIEKTSKTVEILLSSVRPMDILFGKI